MSAYTERKPGSHIRVDINRGSVRRVESPFGDTVDYALVQPQVAGVLGKLLNTPSVLRMPDLENAFLTGAIAADIGIQSLEKAKRSRERVTTSDTPSESLVSLTYVGGTAVRDSIAQEMKKVALWDPKSDPDGITYLRVHSEIEYSKMAKRAFTLNDEQAKTEAIERARVVRAGQRAMIEFYLTSQEQKRREDSERK